MGQSTSLDSPSVSASAGTSSSSSDLDFLHEQIRKHSLTLRQLTLLTYDELILKINNLNTLSSKFEDCNGKQLLFEVKAGTDTSILWKGTVRVKCVKVDPKTDTIEKVRELNLKQFLQVYHTLQLHLNAGRSGNGDLDEEGDDKQADNDESEAKCYPLATGMSSSLLFENLTDFSPPNIAVEDCCICMERKPEVSLPCTHSYCLTCIERWNVNHKTCPTCRERLENTDETWVLEDVPNESEVSCEIQKSLFSLTR